MPGCCLSSLTAATGLHFTAGYLKGVHTIKNRRRVLPFSASTALCPLEAPRRSSCREKNTKHPDSLNYFILKRTLQQAAVPLQAGFPERNSIYFLIRSLTPQQAAGNALTIAVQKLTAV
jgi:hypothetical protein